MKRHILTLIAVVMLMTTLMTCFVPGANASTPAAERAVGYGISVKGLARVKKMQTFQSSTAWYNLKTLQAVRHYPATKRFDTAHLAYKNGMWFYLDKDFYQQGQYVGVIANKSFEVNTARNMAVLGTNYVPIRNGMPLSQHATSGGQCTARRVWHVGMNNDFVKMIQRVELHLGKTIPMKSASRSYSEQVCLWNAKGRNPSVVAPPGTSRHEKGLAIDVEPVVYQQYDAAMRQHGLCTPVAGEPWHYEPCWAR